MAASPLEGMGFSVANKMVDSVFNEHAANKAFSRQKALLQMQNQMNIDNWRMNNAYNTPERQKERLMAAGLNPDMMYGQQGIAGSFAPPSGASAPSAPMAPMGTTDSASAVNAIANAKLAGAQTAGQLLENDWIGQINAAKIKQMLASAGLSNEQIKLVQPQIEQMQASAAQMRSAAAVSDKQIEMMDWQKFMDFWKESNVSRQVSAQITRWAHENRLTDAQASQVEQMTPELIKQVMLGNANAAFDFLLKELKLNPKGALQAAQELIGNYGELCSEMLPDGLKQFIGSSYNEEEDETGDYVTDGHGNRIPVVKRKRGGKSY